MEILIEEYGMFMISGIALVALLALLTLFQTKFKSASTAFIQDITGVDATYNK